MGPGSTSLRRVWPPQLSSYDYTYQLTRSRWSWEYLRRNAAYARAWKRARRSVRPVYEAVAGLRRITLSRAETRAERWGLSFLRRPRLERP